MVLEGDTQVVLIVKKSAQNMESWSTMQEECFWIGQTGVSNSFTERKTWWLVYKLASLAINMSKEIV